jgi:hypothetical protein
VDREPVRESRFLGSVRPGTYALSGFTTATEGSSMQRRWQVQPNGTGVLSREQLIEALIDGAAILDIAGGVLTCVVGRAPTNLPGEMVMTGAVLEWKDRTDAKPQPEATGHVTETPAADPMAGQLTVDDALEQTEPDGFDYSKLPAEDVEEPQPAR